MKYRWIFPLLLSLALLSLTGCGRSAAEESVTVDVGGPAEAVFTGTVEDGVGRGVLRFADWTYEGTFAENGGLLAGETSNCPWTLVMVGEEMPGRYSGALENGSPVGLGVFRCDNGAVFAGSIRGMAAEKGTAEALPCAVTWGRSRYTGTYDGELENGLPQGAGRFSGRSAAEQNLTWDGGWSAGDMAGEGDLTADRLVTVMEGREQTGAYVGQARDGVPNGQGEFRTVDREGVACVYTGAWKDGRMDGQGKLTFADGSFTPTWVEALAVLGTGEPAFTLTQAQIDFLNAHPELWEAESREDFYNSEYNQQLDRQYRLRNCLQDPDTMAEPRWLIQYSLKVLDVYSGPAFTGGPVITRITAVDDSYQMTVRLLVPGTVDKIAANRRVSFIGLPLQLSSYTTVLGAQNTCVVVVAGEILVSG